jgi:hypothetical protein
MHESGTGHPRASRGARAASQGAVTHSQCAWKDLRNVGYVNETQRGHKTYARCCCGYGAICHRGADKT